MYRNAILRKKSYFLPHSSSVSPYASVAPHHAVARHHNRMRVPMRRIARCAIGAGIPRHAGEPLIRGYPAAGDFSERSERSSFE